MDNLKEMRELQENVVQGLKRLYEAKGISNVSALPHYTYWRQEYYGVRMPIFTKLTDSWEHKRHVEDLENEMFEVSGKVKSVQKDEKKFELFRELKQREYAKTVYAEQFGKLNKGDKFEDYCHVISEIIGECKEHLLYDNWALHEYKQRNNENKKIRLYGKKPRIRRADTKRIFDWFSECKYKYTCVVASKNEEKEFSAYAKRVISQFIFQKDFPMKVENDELVLNDAYLEIQLEMLYNPKLKNLFKIHHYKNDKSEGLSMYGLESICERLTPMFKNVVFDNLMHRQYIYVVERFTGINLAACYLRYYTRIMQENRKNVSESDLERLLLSVLDEFIAMPNLYSRIDILKEYMEPVLFWGGDIKDKLRIVGEEVSRLKSRQCDILTELENDECITRFGETAEWEQTNSRIQQAISVNNNNQLPFLFIEDFDVTECVDEYFKIVCKHTIERNIKLYHKNELNTRGSN